MIRLAAAVAALALAGCAFGSVSGSTFRDLGHSITPGLTLRCSGGCAVSLANVDISPAPGERAVPDHP